MKSLRELSVSKDGNMKERMLNCFLPAFTDYSLASSHFLATLHNSHSNKRHVTVTQALTFTHTLLVQVLLTPVKCSQNSSDIIAEIRSVIAISGNVNPFCANLYSKSLLCLN